MTPDRLRGRFARPPRPRTVPRMKRWFYILSIAIALLVLALLGWTVQGLRWVAAGRPRRASLATALR